jgi:hypothetical protein
MESLPDLAARLDAAANRVAGARAVLDGLAVDAPAFAADAPGRLGEIGRVLQAQWAAALAARSREAAAAGGRLEDAAQAVRIVAGGYREADRSAARRLATEA